MVSITFYKGGSFSYASTPQTAFASACIRYALLFQLNARLTSNVAEVAFLGLMHVRILWFWIHESKQQSLSKIFPQRRNKRPSVAAYKRCGCCQSLQAKGDTLYTRLNNTQLMHYSPFRNLEANLHHFAAKAYKNSLKSNECTCTLQFVAFTGAALQFPIL